jgi:hypothetical protein
MGASQSWYVMHRVIMYRVIMRRVTRCTRKVIFTYAALSTPAALALTSLVMVVVTTLEVSSTWDPTLRVGSPRDLTTSS